MALLPARLGRVSRTAVLLLALVVLPRVLVGDLDDKLALVGDHDLARGHLLRRDAVRVDVDLAQELLGDTRRAADALALEVRVAVGRTVLDPVVARAATVAHVARWRRPVVVVGRVVLEEDGSRGRHLLLRVLPLRLLVREHRRDAVLFRHCVGADVGAGARSSSLALHRGEHPRLTCDVPRGVAERGGGGAGAPGRGSRGGPAGDYACGPRHDRLVLLVLLVCVGVVQSQLEARAVAELVLLDDLALEVEDGEAGAVKENAVAVFLGAEAVVNRAGHYEGIVRFLIGVFYYGDSIVALSNAAL